MEKFEKAIGETKGIGKLIELKDEKTGIFKCLECGKEYKGNLHSWYYRGRNKCLHKNTSHYLYDRYAKMINRCQNPSAIQYKYYGGKGIEVCESWLNSFDNFLTDMEPSFTDGLELDRIDNSKGYSPQNCRWVTHSKNMLNRKGFKNKVGYPGVRKNYNKYYGRFQKNKINYQTKSYDTAKDAYKALQDLKLSL